MRKVLEAIDRVSDWTGRTIRWGYIALVIVISYEVIARFVFNAPTKWVYETSMMLIGTVYIFAMSYTMLHRAHVRIDVFYRRMSPRSQAITDVIGTLIAFFPLLIIFIYISAFRTWDSFVTGERGQEGYWYPLQWPFRTAITLGFILLFLQGSVQFFRDIYMLVRRKPYD